MDTSGEKEVYQIKIAGTLDPSWSEWLGGMEIRTETEAGATTTLSGVVSDQTTLRGILCKLWDLNFKVISICLVEESGGEMELEGLSNE